MRRLLLATLAGAALIAGAGTTRAQTISVGGDDHKNGWTTAPVAASTERNKTRRARHKQAKSTAPRGGYKTPGAGSQEPMPQSPPGGY
jgi:hypothetical protein